MTVDFGNMDFITSEGLRGTMGWLHDAIEGNPSLAVAFENLPASGYRRIVRMVRKMIPKNVTTVRTVFVPYACDNCVIDVNILVNMETISKMNDLMQALPRGPKCEKCGEKMIPDIDVERFDEIVRKRPM